MKTVIKMKDLKKSDGFTDDIDRNKKVAIQIFNLAGCYGGIILYTSKNGMLYNESLPLHILEKYKKGLYFINP